VKLLNVNSIKIRCNLFVNFIFFHHSALGNVHKRTTYLFVLINLLVRELRQFFLSLSILSPTCHIFKRDVFERATYPKPVSQPAQSKPCFFFSKKENILIELKLSNLAKLIVKKKRLIFIRPILSISKVLKYLC
jgi:hypothetical protein